MQHQRVSLFREPDAGNLHVRFDEREQETESGQTGLRRCRESDIRSHRETKATAPVLDSTPHITHNRPSRRGHARLEAVVHRERQPLFAADIPLGSLYRGVTQQELNLLQLSTCGVA